MMPRLRMRRTVGLNPNCFEVMDNGSDGSRTILTECNQDLRDRFETAAYSNYAKGQGNLEDSQ